MTETSLYRRKEERVVLLAAVAFLVFAVAWTTFWRGGSTDHLIGPMSSFFGLLLALRLQLGIALLFFCVVCVLRPPRFGAGPALRRTGVALLATGIFFAAFTMTKSAMPLITPFWADPLLTRIDAALHGGHAFDLAHRMAPWLDAGHASTLYIALWMPLALGFPAIILLFDPDPQRRRCFLILYAVAWVGLGNLVALALLSGGPIYADRLTGMDTFAHLPPLVESSGIADSVTGRIHEVLWQAYVNQQSSAGTGISAFPSVHVAVATLGALYMADRWRWLGLLGAMYVGVILFLSAWLGWHYLVDGYASIAVLVLAWLWLRQAHPATALPIWRALRAGSATRVS